MNTFLPYPDFERSAASLDRQRLGKQRLEVFQILRTLAQGGGWANHPAVRMWRGHERHLARYGVAVCREWRSRGYADSLEPRIVELGERFPDGAPPPWLGDPAFHRAHRGNLVRKDPEWYGTRFPDGDPTLPYVWPEISPGSSARPTPGTAPGSP